MYARTKSAGALAVLAVLLAGCTGTSTPIPQDSSTSAPAVVSRTAVSAPSDVSTACQAAVLDAASSSGNTTSDQAINVCLRAGDNIDAVNKWINTLAGDATSSPVKKAAKPRVSSCDQAREAFLTGSKADVTKALKRLKADRSADGTAREYAGYYLGRDSSSKDLRQMDQTLIVASCEV